MIGVETMQSCGLSLTRHLCVMPCKHNTKLLTEGGFRHCNADNVAYYKIVNWSEHHFLMHVQHTSGMD